MTGALRMAVHKGRALTSSRCPSSDRAYPWRRTGFKMRYSATLEIREMEALITGTNTRVMWERQSRTREVQAGRGVKMETAVDENGRCAGCYCAHCAALLRMFLTPALLSRRVLDLLSRLVASFKTYSCYFNTGFIYRFILKRLLLWNLVFQNRAVLLCYRSSRIHPQAF